MQPDKGANVGHPVAVTSQTPAPAVVVVQQTRGNGFAVAALVLGICALVVGVIPLIGLFITFVPTLLAIIFGIVGIVRGSRIGRGTGVAVAGLVLGSLTLLLYFVGYGLLW